ILDGDGEPLCPLGDVPQDSLLQVFQTSPEISKQDSDSLGVTSFFFFCFPPVFLQTLNSFLRLLSLCQKFLQNIPERLLLLLRSLIQTIRRLLSAFRTGISSRPLLCIQHTINTDPAEVVTTFQGYRIGINVQTDGTFQLSSQITRRHR
ncbi:hypothetical protein AB205_0020070, partial [Aquarana catesbeiana]